MYRIYGVPLWPYHVKRRCKNAKTRNHNRSKMTNLESTMTKTRGYDNENTKSTNISFAFSSSYFHVFISVRFSSSFLQVFVISRFRLRTNLISYVRIFFVAFKIRKCKNTNTVTTKSNFVFSLFRYFPHFQGEKAIGGKDKIYCIFVILCHVFDFSHCFVFVCKNVHRCTLQKCGTLPSLCRVSHFRNMKRKTARIYYGVNQTPYDIAIMEQHKCRLF